MPNFIEQLKIVLNQHDESKLIEDLAFRANMYPQEARKFVDTIIDLGIPLQVPTPPPAPKIPLMLPEISLERSGIPFSAIVTSMLDDGVDVYGAFAGAGGNGITRAQVNDILQLVGEWTSGHIVLKKFEPTGAPLPDIGTVAPAPFDFEKFAARTLKEISALSDANRLQFIRREAQRAIDDEVEGIGRTLNIGVGAYMAHMEKMANDKR